MLAIRKHMRMARSGRIDPEALAKANSWQLRRVAADFLGSSMLQRSGTEAGGRDSGDRAPQCVKSMSAVLCFDEMQVRQTDSTIFKCPQA